MVTAGLPGRCMDRAGLLFCGSHDPIESAVRVVLSTVGCFARCRNGKSRDTTTYKTQPTCVVSIPVKDAPPISPQRAIDKTLQT